MIDLPPPPVSYQPSSVATPPPLPGPPQFRPTALLAWLVIIAVCIGIPVLRAVKQEAAAAPTTLPVTGTVPPPGPDHVNVQLEMAGRMWVGLVRVFTSLGGDEARRQFEKSVDLPQDTPTERLAAAVILKELRQDEKADKLLDQTDDADAETLQDHYAMLPVEPLPAELRERLGWYARLAEVYDRPDTDAARAVVLSEAMQSAVTVGVAFFLLMGALIVGLGLFIASIVLLSQGKLPFAFRRPIGPAHVYIETVAIYLGGFVAVSLLIAWLLPNATIAANVVGLGGVVVLASIWPLLRGARFPELRQDWGLHSGRGVVREMVAGVGGYIAGLPIVAVGFAITMVLITVTHSRPTHPIMSGGESGAGVGPVIYALMLYGIAAVFAPLTEELLFRGALVSHLRAGVNAVLAAAISGFVFAVVHPQGWTVVPVLMAVGAVLALVRQWRGSLIASITAHAMHNGLLVTIMLLATG